VLSHQGFFFVDKRFEISNLELIKDMDRIIRLEEFLRNTVGHTGKEAQTVII
jgi:hypothetical protein